MVDGICWQSETLPSLRLPGVRILAHSPAIAAIVELVGYSCVDTFAALFRFSAVLRVKWPSTSFFLIFAFQEGRAACAGLPFFFDLFRSLFIRLSSGSVFKKFFVYADIAVHK